MSAQCATCRLRGHKWVTSKCKSGNFGGDVKKIKKKDVKSSGWRPLLPRNSEKLLTARLCEDSRVMRAMLHFYIFILTRSIFFFLTISVPFTSVTASSKRHLCFVQTWCETPLFRYMEKKKAVSILFPFWKQKWGLMRKKKTFTQCCDDVTSTDKEKAGPTWH